MKAILINSDRSLRWDTVPDPTVADGEVLVRIDYAAVNRADLLQREGGYPPPPGCPEWMGLEIAGEVVSLSPAAEREGRFGRGDRVCALLGGGGYAEYVSVRTDMLMPIPRNCTPALAAALPEAFATAYLNLFTEARLREGETLLVTAGGSGLAGVVIPMAKAFGARVLTTVRSAGVESGIQGLGADRIIRTDRESLADALRGELEAGHGVDVVLDCLGGAAVGQCLPYLAHGARWVQLAALAGQTTEIDLKTVYVRGIRLIGSTLRSRTPAFKAELLAALVREIWPKIEDGTLCPAPPREFLITEAEEAHAVLYRGGNVGKLVLRVPHETEDR